MLTLVFLKVASDLAMYYTFSAFFAGLMGAKPGAILGALAVQAGMLTLSYVMRRWGKWRLLPAALALLGLLLPGLESGGRVAVAAGAIYVLVLALRENYEPDWIQQKEVFSLFWKAFLLFILVALFFSKPELLWGASVPFALAGLTLSILLTRSLRHEKGVYCRLGYQTMNAFLVAAVLVLVLVLTSDAALVLGQMVTDFIGNFVFRPIFDVFIFITVVGEQIFAWIVSLFEPMTPELPDLSPTPEPTPSFPPTDYSQAVGQPSPPNQQAGDISLVIILLLLTAVVLFLLLKVKRGRHEDKAADVEERCQGVAPPPKREEAPSIPAAAQVRVQYKKFLRLAPVRRSHLEKSDTSLDIRDACTGRLDDEAVAELRELYIKARYQGCATKTEAKRAKELYKRIKKSAAQ